MSVSFKKLTAGELNQGAIIPQALDNQWAPTKVLRKLAEDKKPLNSWDERKKTVLSEWRRSLIYAPQVIVNRAALVNNSVVVEDYSGKNKKYFQELLSRRVIVDFLLAEESPVERPRFEISDEKWLQWTNVIKDTEVACVRLDWGNQADDFQNISAVFHRYIQSLNMPDRVEHLTNALDIPRKERVEFKAKLVEVAGHAFNTASQGKNIVRNELYKKFVCVDNTSIDAGYYDKDKRFSVELKEIFDLRYTVNLPDALGRYAFTPKGSPDRTLLGDVGQSSLHNMLKDNRISELIDTLKQMNFAMLNEAMYLKGLDILTLEDVIEVRNTDEWATYTNSLNSLLANPLSFGEKADDVATNFTKLNLKITNMKIKKIKKSATNIVSRWQPGMMIVVAVGGALLRLYSVPENPSRILIEELSGPVSVGVAPLAINLKIAAGEYMDLGLSVNFMRKKVNQGREVWDEIRGELKSDPHFKFLEKPQAHIAKDADQSKGESNWDEIV